MRRKSKGTFVGGGGGGGGCERTSSDGVAITGYVDGSLYGVEGSNFRGYV